MQTPSLHTAAANRVVGTSGDDTLSGTDGNDILRGLDGRDHLYGSAGFDRLLGGGGDDMMHGTAGDLLDGGSGVDEFFADYWQQSADLSIDLSGMDKGHTARLPDGTMLRHMEMASIVLGSGDDIAVLGKVFGYVYGRAGDDFISTTARMGSVLEGGDGNDTVQGGRGSDKLSGDDFAAGDDVLIGGRGEDLADYFYSPGVSIDLRLSGPQDTGGAGRDTLIGIENVYGGGGADRLTGDSGDNELYGREGQDTLVGGEGDDDLIGDFRQWPPGGEEDVLDGGGGRDFLTGGYDDDVFLYHALSDSTVEAPDLIWDLDDGSVDGMLDIIDLSAIDADSHKAGDQAFRLVHDQFGGKAGEALLTYDPTHGRTLLQLDVDGDGQADSLIIIVADHHDFTGFVL